MDKQRVDAITTIVSADLQGYSDKIKEIGKTITEENKEKLSLEIFLLASFTKETADRLETLAKDLNK